jgi:hypothetical protein
MFRRSLALLALTLTGPTSTLAFVFSWAPPSYQCYTQTLSWTGGVPPFKAIITYVEADLAHLRCWIHKWQPNRSRLISQHAYCLTGTDRHYKKRSFTTSLPARTTSSPRQGATTWALLRNNTVLVKMTAYPTNRLEPEQIQLQLYSGIQYVLWMSDATGVGTGGSTNVSGSPRYSF